MKNLNKKITTTVETLAVYKCESECVKSIFSAIKKFATLSQLNVFGFLISIWKLYRQAEISLEKSRSEMSLTDKLRHLRMANFYAAALFSIAFWINVQEIVLNFNL